MNPQVTAAALQAAIRSLARLGGPIEALLPALAVLLAVACVVPLFERWRVHVLGATFAMLCVGETLLIRFHLQLHDICVVVDPFSGARTGSFAVSLWIESEKLYVWALLLCGLTLLARRHRAELLAGGGIITAILMVGAAFWGHPFTAPLPDFLGQYSGYLEALSSGVPQAAQGVFQGLEASRRYYYNTWFMWVHPPLLFISYAAFALSFVATVHMIATRHSSYETTAYRWARLGYVPLTVGMLLGFPWAILAWEGESWWWSGKVNMSIMMWFLYTAVLHARLYLRRRGMWRWVAALSVLSFIILVLTYLATYVVPGAHSYA